MGLSPFSIMFIIRGLHRFPPGVDNWPWYIWGLVELSSTVKDFSYDPYQYLDGPLRAAPQGCQNPRLFV